jgi:hypothetical protein
LQPTLDGTIEQFALVFLIAVRGRRFVVCRASSAPKLVDVLIIDDFSASSSGNS